MRCRKCGGSGEMFVLEKEGVQTIVPFRDVEAYKKSGYVDIGQGITCSLCNGFGVEER